MGKQLIETIFFDLGGVLIDFSHEKMCQNIASYTGLTLDFVKEKIFTEKIGEKYEKGNLSSQDLFQFFSDLSSKSLEFDLLMEATASIFSEKREMPSILQKLKEQNISLFLLSNTCEAHFWYVKKNFPFLSLFDGFVLSYEVGARKPAKEIFKAALEKGQTPVEKCFYTDDVAEYVDAAKKLGLDSHHFQGAEGLERALANRL